MATYGAIGEFNNNAESWDTYVDRLNGYFVANGIVDKDRKRAILNSTAGAQVFQLTCDLLSPIKPKDST